MKKLSKKIISLMLALIMAMPMVFALPQTATAAAGDGKILEWNFLGSSKPSISSPTASVNDSYDQTVSSTYGSATLNLHNWSTGDRHFHYDNDTEGMKSTDGVASLRNLSSYLVDGKDIDIQFTMAVNGNTTASNKGVFAIGSTFGDFADTANTANDLVYLSNTGDIRYRSTSSNTDIRVSGASTSVTQNSYFNYRIYFTYSSHKIDIYRNNILIGTVTNAEIDKNDFVCLVIGAHIPNNFGNFAIKKLTISQYASSEQADFSNFSAESTVASSNIKAFNGTAFIYGSAATGGYTAGTVVYHATGNMDASSKQDKAYMDSYYYAPKNLVLAYDGTKTLIYPVVYVQKKNGDNKQRIHNVTLTSGTNMTMQQNWRGYSDVSGSYSLSNVPWPGMSGTSQISYVNDSSDSITPDNKNTPRAYANYITYTGSVNTSNYYEKLSNITFRFRGYCEYWSWGTKKEYQTIDTTMSNYSVYVINYKPIYDILKSSSPKTVNVNGAKNIRDLRTYLLTGDGSWMYTNASRAEALRRINAVGEVDPNAYGYNSDASTDVALCAAEIKNAYEKFVDIPNILVKNTFTITYDMLGTDKSATVVAGNNISNKSSGDAIPSLSATTYAGSNKHHIYSWSSTGVWDSTQSPSGSHIPHSNETYKENDNLVACDHNKAETPVASDGSTHNGYTDYSCSVCGNTDTKDRVYNALVWTAYNSALAEYNTKTTNGVYTTSTVATCISDAASYIGYNSTANTGENTPQATINTATSEINTAVGKLKEKASFDALDTAYANAQSAFAALTESDYTTSTYALVNTYLSTAGNFPYHSMDAATRADTAADTNQTAINTEAGNLTNAASRLEFRASFTALDTAKNDAIDELDSLASANTTSSVAAARAYLTDASEFPYEYSADRADTGVSKNSEIATEATKFGNWQSASPLDPLADLTYFDAEYDKANIFLKSLDGKAAQYTADSVEDLIKALEAEGTNVDVEDLVSSNAAARADFGQAVQAEANTFADNIKDAYNNLETAKDIEGSGVSEETDTAFIAVTAKLNDADPDAYEVTEGSIESAIRTVNDVIAASTTKSYDGATINVLSGDIDDATLQDLITTVASALTVSTKKYAISKDNAGSQDFSIGIRNGKLEDGKAPYGTTVVATSNDSDTTWYVDIYTDSMHKKTAYAGYGKTYTGKVLGTTTIKAVKKDAGESRVKIIRKYGDSPITEKSPIQVVEYVSTGSSYTLPTAPAIALNTFDGYYIGETKYAAGASVTISADTEVYARYTPNAEADCAIKATGGSAAYSNTVSYNDKVSLTGAADTYGWVEAIDATHYRPFYIGKDVEFFATESTELLAVTSFDGYNFSLPAVNIRKSGVIKNGTRTTINGQLVTNGVNVKEYGILIGAPSSKNGATPVTPTAEQVVIENSGQQTGWAVYRAKSTTLVGANQFTITMNNLPEGYIYRGYMIYEDSKGALHNVYSEAMTE